MDDAQLYEVAFTHALELPGAEERPFAPGWTAVRVAEKWFMVATERQGQQLINVKATPDDITALRQAYTSIQPGYHMNKTHWISITAGDDMSAQFVRELITDSYALIVAALPRAKRPYLSAPYLAN
ncbi:MmcQ/YjbR family DNA-binding protein [Schaalia sp. ZJ405]|uniref:MmcQ/YjbR family DNA-binding protein n=1 Tax=Schaalia sp. ZJ405 TaxID=2709403 RepID=UPI0013EC997F|nr:MmcQ/YjbR family DNA-binding protein [Schaalia sp. ZJ405]QPK80689.1 MmcQ/YjbR family DNA-binding protein [Schaalia sp. ZJ405]